MKHSQSFWRFLMILFIGFWVMVSTNPVLAQELNPNPPERPVKLIFIHHSTGENWLKDGYGNLGRTLDANNYFVSDTNYGWGPNNIGDRTDIPNWIEWFGERRSDSVLSALYQESNLNSADITRHLNDPGGENEIILFKSCFPNSNLDGNPNDPPTPGEDWTVGNAKYIYLSMLPYFASQPNKMFVAITAPPVSDPTFAQNARAFNQWLMTEWLANYQGTNVFVFDFYNILTGKDHHHRYINGKIEHVFQEGHNTNVYPSAPDDDHPNAEGSQKATDEFVPLLNIFYHQWKANAHVSQSSIPSPLPLSTEVLEESVSQQEETIATETIEQNGEAISNAPMKPVSSLLINDFESGTQGLEHYADESGSQVRCELNSSNVFQGQHALEVDYQVVRDGWLDCGFSFGEPQNWSQSSGISFYLKSEQENLPVTFYISCGTDKEAATFVTTLQTTKDWKKVEFRWEDFALAPWAEPGTIKNVLATSILNYGFNVSGGEARKNKIWVDQVMLIEKGKITAPSASASENQQSLTAEATEATPIAKTTKATSKNKALPCMGGLLPLMFGLWLVFKKK